MKERPQRDLEEHIEYRWLRGDSIGDARRSVWNFFRQDIPFEDMHQRFIQLCDKWSGSLRK